jgi:hypothetical protein
MLEHVMCLDQEDFLTPKASMQFVLDVVERIVFPERIFPEIVYKKSMDKNGILSFIDWLPTLICSFCRPRNIGPLMKNAIQTFCKKNHLNFIDTDNKKNTPTNTNGKYILFATTGNDKDGVCGVSPAVHALSEGADLAIWYFPWIERPKMHRCHWCFTSTMQMRINTWGVPVYPIGTMQCTLKELKDKLLDVHVPDIYADMRPYISTSFCCL